ncbi:MAG: preprotein translocase subunit SecG [Longimicrobiales bacterium]
MFGFLVAVLILDGILLMTVVLLQAGKGGGLAAMGGASMGTDSLIGGRQAANLLTRTTWVSGGVFLALSLVLAVMSSRARQPDSILRQEFQQTAPTGTPQPVVPGIEPSDAEGAGGQQIPGMEPSPQQPEGNPQP